MDLSPAALSCDEALEGPPVSGYVSSRHGDSAERWGGALNAVMFYFLR